MLLYTKYLENYTDTAMWFCFPDWMHTQVLVVSVTFIEIIRNLVLLVLFWTLFNHTLLLDSKAKCYPLYKYEGFGCSLDVGDDDDIDDLMAKVMLMVLMLMHMLIVEMLMMILMIVIVLMILILKTWMML